MNQLQERVPPHNRDAERGVLGAVLRDPDILPDVLAVVRHDAMYFDAHRKVLAAIEDLVGRGQPADLVLLHEELQRRRQLEDVGGVAYLAELWDSVPTGANALYHARIVRDSATMRGLIHAANEILRDAHDRAGPADELLAQAEQKLYALSDTSASAEGEPRRVNEIVRESLEVLDARINSAESLAGLATGYQDLDHFTGGLRPGELVVIGARPSLGKTALSLNLAERVARAGTPVLFFSLEMPARDLGDRLLAMQTGVPMLRMSRPCELTRDEIDALSGAIAGPLGQMPLYVDDTPDQTAARIASVARRACRRREVRLVVVDYLQLVRPENPRENRAQQVGTIAHRMKNLARGLNVPVLLLSQLNRELEQTNRKPKLSDLRESGEIEQHADRVWLLHRDASLSYDEPVWPVEVILAKQRNGPVGEIVLAYQRPVMRFEHAIQE